MLRFRKESGQSMVEFALVLPVFLMILFAIIDFSWIGYQYICFDYSYREASWELSIDNDQIEQERYINGKDATQLILRNVKNSALGIITDNLTVSNAKIHLWSNKKTDHYPGAGSKYEDKTNYWRYMELTANLKYKIYPITPLGKLFIKDALVYTKKVDKTRLLQTKSV